MLTSLKSWSMICGLRLNRLTSGLWVVHLCLLAHRVVTRLDPHWMLQWRRASGSTTRDRFLVLMHERQTQGWTSRKHSLYHVKSSVWHRQEMKTSLASLLACGLPTAPLSQFRLDLMTQNEILVQFHNYFVLYKVL